VLVDYLNWMVWSFYQFSGFGCLHPLRFCKRHLAHTLGAESMYGRSKYQEKGVEGIE
jgi:hypothetical protein